MRSGRINSGAVSDTEFVAVLVAVVGNYFAAVDQWESAYRRYYRMPGATAASSDMAAEQRQFEGRRRELRRLLPRARFLCLKYGRSDVFAGLPHVSLGQYAPQQRSDSAIGRSERSAVAACLNELGVLCREADAGLSLASETPPTRPSLIDRIVAFFD
jgi:hypothetical protein